MRRTSRTRPLALAALAALVLVTAACGGSDDSSSGSNDSTEATTVRLGYFPNVTHATAIVGVEEGIYADKLGTDKLDPKNFKDGTEAVEALNADAIDATYIGSGPAINLFQKSDGKAIKIISGATSGGASLVVAKDIDSAADLKGKTIATPKLGNTQDISARAWLKDQGLETTTSGGGDVKIAPQENAQTLDAFKAGSIDGAWVPEPWATRLVLEGDGKVLVDERSLFADEAFVTTNLIVSQKFLSEHPDTVKRLLEGQVAANAFVNANPEKAQQITNAGIKKITGKDLPPEVIAGAWKNLDFTDDPLAASLQEAADDAKAVGLLDSSDITGIYDLAPLNQVLEAEGQPPVAGLGS